MDGPVHMLMVGNWLKLLTQHRMGACSVGVTIEVKTSKEATSKAVIKQLHLGQLRRSCANRSRNWSVTSIWTEYTLSGCLEAQFPFTL